LNSNKTGFNLLIDREDAMKDDFGVDGSYTYEDDDEAWNDDEADWAENEGQDEDPTDAKDESSAYLEFLNEEVTCFKSF